MITKQELIDIMKEGWQQTGYYSVNFNANMVADKILERIKKELEVLEILKTIIKKSTQFNGIISIDNEINSVRATSFLTKTEYKLLKGWLYNEKK